MSTDPNKWVNTIPFIGAKSNQEKYKLDSNRWVNTLPRKDDNTLILSNAINSNLKSSLKINIKSSNKIFPEEKRSLQPSAVSVLRCLLNEFEPAFKQACESSFSDIGSVPFGFYGAFGYELLFQFEKDEDKTSEEKYFQYGDGSTWLEIISTGLVKIRSRFDFSDFPFDTQVLKIQYQTDQLPSGEDSDGFTMTSISFIDQVLFSLNKYMDHNYLQEWKVLSTNASSNFIKTESGHVDQLTLSVEIQRNKKYYISKIIFPVLLILVVAWCVLWIPTKEIESRLTTSIVAFLSLIAFNFVFQDDIPKLDILTSLDLFILLSYVFCAIPIFTTIRLSKSIEKNQKRASSWNRKIRLVGGAIYIFLTLTIFYPSL